MVRVNFEITIEESGLVRVHMEPDENACDGHIQLIAEFCTHHCCTRSEDGFEKMMETIQRRMISFVDVPPV